MSEKNSTKFNILALVSIGHFLNDTMQSLMIAIYPMLKNEFTLTFTQIGLITLFYNISGSLLQPLVGFYTDKYHKPYFLTFSIVSTFCGLISLAFAPNFYFILMSAVLIGIGSSIFHPEASRIARMASGGRHGLSQSIFQIGGNMGSAVGPLIAVWLVLPNGQSSLSYISIIAFISIPILFYIGSWYKNQHRTVKNNLLY